MDVGEYVYVKKNNQKGKIKAKVEIVNTAALLLEFSNGEERFFNVDDLEETYIKNIMLLC